MPEVIFGASAYRRDYGNFPEFKLVNMFLEQTATAKGGVSLLSFPGLATFSTVGSGPINGMFQRSGSFGGSLFTVSGSELYKDSTLLGTINGTGPVSWAVSDTELVVTRGQSAYSYNGTNLAAISFPDGANVTAVTFIGGLFVFARAGSHKFYWSAVLNARSVDPLDFASAESSPDKLRDVVAINDNIFLMGEDSIEVWYITGELALPFSRISQRTVHIGVIATDCALELDNALHFIGSDAVIYRFGDVPERISDNGIEERLWQSNSYRCFSYKFEGHSFLCIRLSQGTWCYDAATQSWHERQTWGLTNWDANCAADLDDGPYFGSAVGGHVLRFGGWAEGASPLVRRFTAAFPIEGGVAPVDLLEVEANTGSASDYVDADDDSKPKLEMAFSRDGGDTWSDWRAASLGTQGKYRKRARFRRLGYFDAPGALFDFRMTEAASFRVSAVIINESAAGRSR